jgi:hypothetical protein
MTETRGNNPGTTRDAQTRPNPPRLWWLKRLSLAGLFLIVALAALRWWWGHEAQRGMDAMIAAAHAKGEPILPEDFDFPPVPDAENAAIPLMRAERLMRWNAPERLFWSNFHDSQPLSATDISTIEGMMQRHATELQLVRSVRGLAKVNWGMRIQKQTELDSSDWLLQHSLHLSALREHSRGDEAAAVEYLRDMFALARVSGTRTTQDTVPLMQSNHAWAANSVRDVLPSLLAGKPDGVAQFRPAGDEQVRGLIADLLDERCVREAFIQGVFSLRTTSLFDAEKLANSQINFRPLARLALPIFKLRCTEFAKQADAVLNAARQQNYAASLAALPPPGKGGKVSAFLWIAHGGEASQNWEYLSEFELAYRVLTERRVTATMLALELYARDHAGRLPETLKDLVPAYLPAVPIDPLSLDSRPLGYFPHRDPPAIYSVGYDGTDDGAPADAKLSGIPHDPWKNEKDVMFFLRPLAPVKDDKQ